MTINTRKRDAADYESLRARALCGGILTGAALLRRGLAAWLDMPHPPDCPALRISPPATASQNLASAGPLCATVAEIIFRLTREASHA